MADLSPAAQAVLNATKVKFYEDPPTGAELAAWILRALADHQPAPITLGQPIDHWCPDERTRQELRNIAEELEGGQAEPPRRHLFPTPHQIAECGGPCEQGGPEACDCGLYERSSTSSTH